MHCTDVKIETNNMWQDKHWRWYRLREEEEEGQRRDGWTVSTVIMTPTSVTEDNDNCDWRRIVSWCSDHRNVIFTSARAIDLDSKVVASSTMRRRCRHDQPTDSSVFVNEAGSGWG